jgi:hypothetical protein
MTYARTGDVLRGINLRRALQLAEERREYLEEMRLAAEKLERELARKDEDEEDVYEL